MVTINTYESCLYRKALRHKRQTLSNDNDDDYRIIMSLQPKRNVFDYY